MHSHHRPVYCDSAAVALRLSLMGAFGWLMIGMAGYGAWIILDELWGAL